jgi:hypothetical protein
MLTIPMAQSDGDLNSSRPAECTEFKGPVSKRLISTGVVHNELIGFGENTNCEETFHPGSAKIVRKSTGQYSA